MYSYAFYVVRQGRRLEFIQGKAPSLFFLFSNSMGVGAERRFHVCRFNGQSERIFGPWGMALPC